MRLFTGISLSPDVINSLERAIGELRSSAALGWSLSENLHITTKFIGEWPEGNLPALVLSLQDIRLAPIEISVSRFGYFPNPHCPTTLFAGVRSTPELESLARMTEAAVVEAGGKREDRPYIPHVTLARFRGTSIVSLREKMALLGPLDFGTFQAEGFHLYLSESRENIDGQKGSTYKKLETFPFVKEAYTE